MNTTTIKEFRPRFMVAMWHPVSLHPVTSDMAVEALGLIEAGKAVETSYDPSGPYQYCFLNVEQRVEREGGSMALGWVMDLNSGAATRNRNRLAKTNLEAHAVWRRPDGHLVEVTEGNDSFLFLPHGAVKAYTNGSIVFMDNYRLAAQWHVAGAHNLVVPIPFI